jgi:PAS domain S-box-containing protein
MPHKSAMSDKKPAEESIHESERKYRLLAENVQDVVWTADLNGNITYISPSVEAQTGYLPEEYCSQPLANFLTPESAARVAEVMKGQLLRPLEQRDKSVILELRERKKSGDYIDIEANASWLRDANGNPVGFVGVTRDITTRKQAERELRESEERFRAFVSLASEGIVVHENGMIIDANQAAADLMGFPSPESLIGKHGLDDLPITPESKIALRPHLSNAATESVNAEITRQDGTHVRALVRGRAVALRGRFVRIVSLLDITDRYETELALRDSEAKFRTIGMSAPDAMILINDDGLVEYWNPAAERTFGYTASEMQGMDVHSKLLPESYATRFQTAFRKFQETGAGDAIGRLVELTAKRKDGSEFPIEIAVNPILIHEKYWASAIIRDITDRKHAEEERALNARRLAALLELNQMSSVSLHDLIHFALEEAVKLTGSTIGYIAFANEDESILKLYAWSAKALAECAIIDKPILYPVISTGLWGEAVRQRRPIITNNYAADNPWKKGIPEGHVTVLRHMNVPIFDGNRIVVVAGVGNKPTEYDVGDVRQLTLLMEGMWRIVSHRQAEKERKSLQDQLAQASKMEAIGRLAGGVAHDFNNLLTTILGYSEMIQSQLSDGAPFRSEVDEIRKAGERAASLTQQLLAFSRKQVITPRVIDLNATVKEARKMLERLIGENIHLVFDLAPNLGCIRVDPHQIDQVLLNLAVNSRDAMLHGGTLTISTANTEFDSLPHSHLEISPGSYIVLSVADTGVGMDEKTKAQAFEPFFSTKEKGKGTGLGLAMVYGIVKQNGGAVSVYSEPGMGTVFRVYIPRVDETPTPGDTSPPSASPTGKETILLAEDNDMVRHLAQRIINRLGYTVIEACDAKDAIRIGMEYSAPIHLLLSDVIMPGMNGIDLYDRLQKVRPGMKVLFMSGYAEDAVVRQDVLPAGTEFIQKPFNAKDLANRIRQALDKS